MMMMMMIPLSQCYTVARTTMGDMTDWEKILWYCLYNCSPPIFLCGALYWELSEEKRHRGRVFCRKPPYDWLGKTKSIKSANIPQMIDYRFEFFVLRKKSVWGNHFSFACISSYSLILWYLLFERVLMFETNWHLFGQNKIVFTRKSVFGRKLC